MVQFDVELNEVPIHYRRTGRDIVVDWEILDNFETNNTLYVDANGLEMQEKFLFKRKEFTLQTDNTVASNFYPVTSALSVRDTSGFSQNQVTIMTDRSQAGSAGLRDQSNIEMILQRRHNTHDEDGLGNTLLDERDPNQPSAGLKVSATYWMQISQFTSTNSTSAQRIVQNQLEKPLLQYFIKDYELEN